MVAVTKRRLTPWMYGVGAVTFLAGLLFGYDQGVISGALPLLQVDLDLSTIESEIVTSWVTLGALVGALVAGGTADRIGRRYTAVFAGILFAVGALIEAVSPDAGLLTFGRVVTGLGVGFASVVAPLYAAEMAPKRLRGRFVSTYQLAITVGILFAYIADDALTSSDRWRLMFALAVIPGVALVILVAQFFLSVVDAIGESTTFFIFSALCIVTFVFVWYFVPETRGRSLEEIQERWVMKGDRMLEEEHAA